MAAEQTNGSSPKLHRCEQLGYQMDSQASGNIVSNFLPPLKDSQETQELISGWRDNDAAHQTDVIDQLPGPTKGLFISRPEPENPLDFQNGFQYSKAPSHKNLPAKPSTLPKGILGQNGSKNDGAVRMPHQYRGTDHSTVNSFLHEAKNIRGATTQPIEPPPNMKEKANCGNSPPSDSHTDKAMSGSGRPGKRDLDACQDDPTLRPPFQNTSPMSRAFSPSQFSQRHIRSPASKFGEAKLSKAFSNIQRKALIQSNQTQYDSQSRVDKVSPSIFSKLDMHQHAGGIPEGPITQNRHCQAQLGSDSAMNKLPAAPVAQTPPAVQASRNSRHSTTKVTRPYSQHEDEDYIMRERPESQASNVSRRRAPIALKHKHSKRRQRSRTPPGLNAPRHKLAESFNNYFAHEDSRKRQWKEKVEIMTYQLAESDNRVKEYLAEVQERDRAIAGLKTANEEQRAINQKQECALNELEKQQQSLRGKMKEFRGRLNDSTKEQQNIFKYFQPRYHDMREQLKQAEQSHEGSLEHAISTTDEIRAQIQKSVEEVRTLSQQEILKLRIEIATAQEKLRDREKEVDMEKNHTNDLRQELKESREMNKDALEVLSAQNQELMRKSNEGAILVQNIDDRLNQQGVEIQSLLSIINNNGSSTVNRSELAKSLNVLKTEVLDFVHSAFREHATYDRELYSKATMELKAEIVALNETCSSLGKQIQAKQNGSDWQDEYAKVWMDYQALRFETDRLTEELLKAKDEDRTQLNQLEGLRQELATMRANAEAMGETENRTIQNLEKAKENMQVSLNEKEECIGGLEDKLKESKRTLDALNHQLEDQNRQISDERKKHAQDIATCSEKQAQAIEQAKTKESERARAQYEAIQKRLKGAEQDCSQLQQELGRVKHGAENALKAKEDEAARQMQESLEPAVNRMEKILKGLHTLEQEKGDLGANLNAWSTDHIELSLLQQVVRKLFKEQQEAIGNGKQLCELLDVQKKLEDTWQLHQSEVDAIKRAVELEKSVNAERGKDSRRGHKGKRLTEIAHIANRRVMIQSPGLINADDGAAIPMSIEEERVTRRRAASPTSIMKPALLQAEDWTEAPCHKTPVAIKETGGRSGREAANHDAASSRASHSAYNRPVLGTEELAGGDISKKEESAFANVPSSSKRKEAGLDNERRKDNGKKLRLSEKRAEKISQSMSSYFRGRSPKEPANRPSQQQVEPRQPTGRLVERRSRSVVTYRPTGSGTS